MATAEFDAEYVYAAAVARIAELRAENTIIKDKHEAARQKRIDKFVTYRGGFLWLTVKTRSRSEAEKAYKRHDHPWGEYPPYTYSTRDETNIARIAKAAMSQTVRVTLTADDCRAIGIPVGFEVSA